MTKSNQTKENNFELKVKLLLHKRYFDQGMGLLNYAKYIVLFFGFASANVRSTMILALIWGVLCYILGRYYYRKKWMDADMEISNRVNPFVDQMRKFIKE